MPVILAFLRKFAPWLLSKLGADTVETLLKGTVALGVEIGVLTAWGVLLAVVSTGIAGLGIRDIALSNPFSGIPSDMMFLVNSAFPCKFAVSLATSYIIFRFTVNKAALTMSRTVKYLFGG